MTETIGSLVVLVLITLGWHFLFDFGWGQSLFLSFLLTTFLSGIFEIGVDLRRIVRHLGIGRDTDD